MTSREPPERGIIDSPWLGQIEWDPRFELFFPCGLPGFEEERRILPVGIKAHEPLVYLQSVESAGTCFVSLPVLAVDREFHLELAEEEREALGIEEGIEPAIGTDVLCLALLAPCNASVEANLRAPLVINLHNYRGIQLMPDAARARFRLGEQGAWEELC